MAITLSLTLHISYPIYTTAQRPTKGPKFPQSQTIYILYQQAKTRAQDCLYLPPPPGLRQHQTLALAGPHLPARHPGFFPTLVTVLLELHRQRTVEAKAARAELEESFSGDWEGHWHPQVYFHLETQTFCRRPSLCREGGSLPDMHPPLLLPKPYIQSAQQTRVVA